MKDPKGRRRVAAALPLEWPRERESRFYTCERCGFETDTPAARREHTLRQLAGWPACSEPRSYTDRVEDEERDAKASYGKVSDLF